MIAIGVSESSEEEKKARQRGLNESMKIMSRTQHVCCVLHPDNINEN